ncbi:MAG: hypothetical protein EOP05_18025 [Proteobacteria bacterium]|nr:MAG: hypothetical protein EOP05_18025 [Pseudomonadota bacterium]
MRSYALALGLKETESVVDRFLFNRLENKWRPGAVYTPGRIEKRIEQSYELLEKLQFRQGLVDHRQRDFNANPDEASRWAEQALLRQGLLAQLDQPSPSQIQKLKLKVRKVLESRAMTALWSLLTLTLPTRSNKDVPAELLANITVDGIDAHLPELRQHYNLAGQDRVDRYQRLRKALRNLVIGLNLLMVSHQVQSLGESQQAATSQQQAESQKQYDQMMKGLDNLEAAIDEI